MARTSNESFGQLNFAHAQLGDKRRTKRLVSLADRIHRHPGGTLPDKIKSPTDLKALYRMCNCEAVPHAAVMNAVRQRTLEKIAETEGGVLIVHDTTELDYTAHKSLADQLGQIGDGGGKGYICHNSLAVVPDQRTAIGLTNQILHHCADVPENETQREHRERESRESRLWLKGTEGLPGDARLVDVCDRGADTFEFLEYEQLKSGRSFVVRSSQNRMMLARGSWTRDEEASAARLAAVAAERRQTNGPHLRPLWANASQGRCPGELRCCADTCAAGPQRRAWKQAAADVGGACRRGKPAGRRRTNRVDFADEHTGEELPRRAASPVPLRMSLDRRRTSQRAKDRLPNRTNAVYRHQTSGTDDRYPLGRGGGPVEPARCVATTRCKTKASDRPVQHGLRTSAERVAMETNL